MPDLDFGPHRKCAICNTLMPQRRMIEYEDKWYCGLKHKLEQERKDNANLRNTPSTISRLYE